MCTLQQHILKQQRAESCPPPAEGCIASATSTLTSSTPVMEEDEELERAMLNLSPSELYTERRPPAAVSRARLCRHQQGFLQPSTVKAPLPVPPQLLAMAPKLGIEVQAPNVLRQNSSPHNMAPVEAQGDTVLDEAVDICDTVL
ncbi:hypothetical protein KUCAC02_019018 [Chaenocephalus aceratus]|uniref:Uncharacterized protein n=1 Tax=Chaenocephalus aceratus TaxID=36190 RepID=A0ACB9WAA2_CHAAC|nr:hypothetical protein KUCAC02_019018 [Chaenocephalus aceratus]